MRTGRGDLIDSSPAQRVEVVSGRSDGSSRTIAQDCAQLLANADSDAINELGKLGFGGIYVIKQNGDKAQREASNQLNSNIGASDGTQNVVSLDNGTYYRLTVQDLSKQHIDRSGLDKAGSSVWRRSWLWCMGVVLVAYCLVALPRIRRQVWRKHEQTFSSQYAFAYCACRNLGVAHRGPDGRDAHIPAIMAACGHAHGGTLLGGLVPSAPGSGRRTARLA